MPVSYVLGFPAVLVCIVATASMAFRFGWQFGAEPWEQWSFALGLAAMDVIKAFLLLAVAGAWRARQYGRIGVALTAFAVFTGLSLLSSFGMAAIQSALKVGSHTAVASTYNDRKAEVDRLVAQREALQKTGFTWTTADAVKVAQETVDAIAQQAQAEGDSGGCKKRCKDLQAEERTARTALLAAQAGHAATVKAEELDGKIAAARTALEGIDAEEVAREGDPQAAALAVLLGRFIGDDKSLIRSTIHAAIAIGLEIGSGFGLFALFGHHGRRIEDDEEPATADVTALEANPNGAVTIETPSDAVAKFFAECVLRAAGQRVSATQMYAAYERWCGTRSHTPVSYDRFRKLATWRTARIGGRSWYLDAALGGIRLAVDNVPARRALGNMASSAR